MGGMTKTSRTGRRWSYPLLYLLLAIISALPMYTERPYAQQDIQKVIVSLVVAGVGRYGAIAPLFHGATLVIVALIAALGEKMGRVLAAYMGLNYLVIAFVQTIGETEAYGYAVHTGALVACILLAITWLVVALRGGLHTSLKGVPWRRYLLLPLALLAFWSPYDAQVRPDFNPALLLTSPNYGLTLCFTTPVFLFLLVLFYPRVNGLAYRITAFNGLLYGLVNMAHFFDPALRWMGILHLPLLVISVYALALPRLTRTASTG